MKPLLLALFLTCFIAGNAQKEIRLEELKEYIGDSVKVQGKISGMVAPNISTARSTINPYL
jgi:hypothetical protein